MTGGLHLAKARITATRAAMHNELQTTYATASGSGRVGPTSTATVRLESRLRAIDYALAEIDDCLEIEATGRVGS